MKYQRRSPYDIARTPISDLVSFPIVGFPVNHIQIAEPADPNDTIYHWAMARMNDEFTQLATWDAAHKMAPATRKLRGRIDFVSE